jgi:hypothetical protein
MRPLLRELPRHVSDRCPALRTTTARVEAPRAYQCALLLPTHQLLETEQLMQKQLLNAKAPLSEWIRQDVNSGKADCRLSREPFLFYVLSRFLHTIGLVHSFLS